MNTQEIGKKYESEAERFFEACGWQLLDRNFTCRMGEVDLIFKDLEGTIVFVEVKYRSRIDFGFGQEFVGPLKQSRMTKAALTFIKQRHLGYRNYRFDVLAITPKGNTHIPNAFSPEGYTL